MARGASINRWRSVISSFNENLLDSHFKGRGRLMGIGGAEFFQSNIVLLIDLILRRNLTPEEDPKEGSDYHPESDK
jgi:hypothetical protein